MHLGLPQMIYLGIIALNLGITLSKNGEPTGFKYNFWITATSSILTLWILKAGGFFG